MREGGVAQDKSLVGSEDYKHCHATEFRVLLNSPLLTIYDKCFGAARQGGVRRIPSSFSLVQEQIICKSSVMCCLCISSGGN